MVTAILIPIILFYFYWITRKQKKQYYEKWLSAGNVFKEAVITGEIISITEEKERFYYEHFIFIQTLNLRAGPKIVQARKITPMTETMCKHSFAAGQMIRVYGTWRGKRFIFQDYEITKDI